jgi:LPS O-antigen subunit length determinant protein (WzzB/FepE family)
MKKNYNKNIDEIDLIELLKTIYRQKLIILLILFISILIGVIYGAQKPLSIKSSLDIKNSKDTEFTNFLPIYNLVYDDLINPLKKNEPINPEKKKKVIAKPNEISDIILTRFITEILDYEELIIILSNNKKIKKEIAKLNSDEQEQILFNYAQSLSIVRPNKDISTYNLSFIWNDIDESKYILNALLKMAKKNLESRIYKELDDLLTIKKKIIINDDIKRIRYLKEQSAIAKELNIENNQIDSVNLSQSNVSFNINTNNVAYYLRGYKTIDKEIELIKSRKRLDIENIQEDINILKRSNINWADYNINYLNIYTQNKPNLYLMISIGIGFILSMFYVFIIFITKYRNVFK